MVHFQRRFNIRKHVHINLPGVKLNNIGFLKGEHLTNFTTAIRLKNQKESD